MQVDCLAILRARRFAPVHPLRVFPAMNPEIPGHVKNDLDRWRRCGRGVLDGEIPHGFHTK